VFDGDAGESLGKSVTGTPGGRYYCRVQSRDRAGNVSAWTDDTDGISVVNHPGIAIAAAKALAVDDSAGLASRVVSAVFADHFYAQELDRTSGIMVVPSGGVPSGLAVGSLVDVGGPVRSDASFVRWIDGTVSVVPGSAVIRPLALTNVALGGGDWAYGLITTGGQRGVTGGRGLNNIGLFVRTVGEVTAVRSDGFDIDDGSGVGVRVVVPTGAQIPSIGSFVIVDGVSSCYVSGAEVKRMLIVGDAAGVRIVE